MSEIFQKFIDELGKAFSIGENGTNPLGNLPILQNIW